MDIKTQNKTPQETLRLINNIPFFKSFHVTIDGLIR